MTIAQINGSFLTASGTLAAADEEVAVNDIVLQSACMFQVSGTWVGAINFEGSLDGTTWSELPVYDLLAAGVVYGATRGGLFRASVAGLRAVRVVMSEYTSGSASVYARASLGSASADDRAIQPVSFARTSSVDAFNRQRVSQIRALVDARFDFDYFDILFATKVNGGGSVTRDATESCAHLAVGSASGDYAILQTRRSAPYRPARGNVVYQSVNLQDTGTNRRRRVGVFTAANGLFLEVVESGFRVVIRSSVSGTPVDTQIAQSSWSYDRLDGTGPSGVNLFVDRVQLFWIDLQWLAVGAVRFGFSYRGRDIVAHEQPHANETGQTKAYMQSANLPMRWEIENIGATAGAAVLDVICGGASVEGESDTAGLQRSVSRGAVPQSVSTLLLPLISIRLRPGHLRAAVNVLSAVVQPTAATEFHAKLLLNPTIAAGAAAIWLPVTASAIEYDITRTGLVTGGFELGMDYGASNAETHIDPDNLYALGTDVDDNPDEIVLAVQRLSGAFSNFWGGITYLDII